MPRVNAVAACGEGAVLVVQAPRQFGGGPAFVSLISLDLKMLLKPGDDFRENGPGHEDFWFGHAPTGPFT